MNQPKNIFRIIGWLIGLLTVIVILGLVAISSIEPDRGRSALVRAYSDMRSVTTGLQTYYLDHGVYPGSKTWENALTTPVAYLYQVPADATSPSHENLLSFNVYGSTQSLIIYGHGTDQDIDLNPTPEMLNPHDDKLVAPYTYDSTNGLQSNGDILRRIYPDDQEHTSGPTQAAAP